MGTIVALILVFACWPLIKSVIAAAQKDVPSVIENTGRGLNSMSKSLPTLGSQFSTETVIEASKNIEDYKKAVGCTDPAITTSVQLEKWMSQNNMF